jgi:hypothetical protein
MIESVNAALSAKFGEGRTASFAPIAMQPTTHRGFICAKNCDRANRLLRWLRLLLFRILGSQKRQAAGAKNQASFLVAPADAIKPNDLGNGYLRHKIAKC